MKLRFLILTAIIACASSVMAQGDIDKLIQGSKDDANLLVKGYITPAFNILGNGLNQGWYNTAKSHKLLGFDLTITASGIFIPSSDLVYRVDDSQLKSIQIAPYTQGQTQSINAPTVFGSDVAPQYQPINSDGTPKGSAITAAGGTNITKDISFVPIPMVQLGIGLPKGTDLKVRFFPSTKIGNNGNVSLLGLGVMHDVKQYIPGVKSLPFDLSVLLAFTNLKVHVDYDPSNSPDQKGDFSTTATTFQGLISKKFSVLTVYGGLGYNFVSSDLSVKGTYNTSNGPLVDPVNISNSQSGPRVTAGFRLKFAIFTLHGDYTLQKYNAFTAGFGFNVR